jgi:hypothetical protein
MCTVTFIPRPAGYYLAMNRDEQLTRVAGLPLAERIINGRRVICPSEPGGGTWIALNDSRITFALVNWYSVTARVKDNSISRGEIVNMVSASTSFDHANAALVSLPLKRVNPFRLIGIFPEAREIMEWQWDLKNLVRNNHRWKSQQWISSGFDEPTAQRMRSKTFRLAQREYSAGTLPWLRRLHRSHLPGAGPFSTCMHRADAGTVSYTEIGVMHNRMTIRYNGNAPCRRCAPVNASRFPFYSQTCRRAEI